MRELRVSNSIKPAPFYRSFHRPCKIKRFCCSKAIRYVVPHIIADRLTATDRDARGYCPDQVLWDHAVRHCGYVQSRHATGRVLVAAS
ncbi:hypothetical protein C2L64_23555 [Paraburkholderia hospita]|uniref:Uncharacterized protein n=1 Tax=Paraburkholderia hospita TaxID=169430 RepID=A0AAN1JDF1_9BURK|nr:hypothetical protein C2L64_23555 [Paraburkholderia hospita]OUL87467.1 hypothetical protein CA602_13855 [Paraburkholderia hospita]